MLVGHATLKSPGAVTGMEARDMIESQGFDCKGTDFTLTFSVPVSILLRELGLVHWLSRKHPDLSFKHLVDIDSYHPPAGAVLYVHNTVSAPKL